MFNFLADSCIDFSPLIVHECSFAAREEIVWDVPIRYYAEKHLATMSDDELDRDWKLGDFFGTIAVINLPHATERLKNVTDELRQIGTETFKVFRAINGRKELDESIWKKIDSNREVIDLSSEAGVRALDKVHQGEAGCYMSHYKLIEEVKQAFDKAMTELLTAQAMGNRRAIQHAENEVRKYSRVLILEDDAGFGIVNKNKMSVSKKGVGKLFRETLRELPNDWDMIYFMVKAVEPTEEISPHLRKIKSTWGTVAYAVNYTMYEPLLEHLKKIEDPAVLKVFSVDNMISELHPSYKVYAAYPSLVFHYAGKSQVCNKVYEQLEQFQPIVQPPAVDQPPPEPAKQPAKKKQKKSSSKKLKKLKRHKKKYSFI